MFEFSTSHRIIFGMGSVKTAVSLVAFLGKRPLVIVGSAKDRAKPLLEQLERSKLEAAFAACIAEPSIHDIDAFKRAALEHRADCLIGMGGGSVMDAAKATAAMAVNVGQVLDYLEGVGPGKKLEHPALPIMAIPSTAGTGAEVTKNAVLSVPEKKVKASLRHESMLPRIALIDPELMLSLPPEPTAYSGLDALTQVIEPYVSVAANPMTDIFCREGLVRAARSLRQAVRDGQNLEAREDMALASLFGGIALANAKLGAVHGFAGVLGGRTGAAHGAICASLLPHVTQANVAALKQRKPDSQALERYTVIARVLSQDRNAAAEDAVLYLKQLSQDLRVPSLSQLGLKREDFAQTIEQARAASSMKGNPIVLSDEELAGILEAAS